MNNISGKSGDSVKVTTKQFIQSIIQGDVLLIVPQTTCLVQRTLTESCVRGLRAGEEWGGTPNGARDAPLQSRILSRAQVFGLRKRCIPNTKEGF